MLRQGRAAYGTKEVGQEKFVEPNRLEAEVEARRVAEGIETVRKKQMRGIVRVIITGGAGSFAHAHFRHAGALIKIRQTGTAHRTVFVEPETGAIDRPVVIAVQRTFQIVHGSIEAVAIAVEQRGIKPGSGIVSVEVLGDGQFFE